MKKYVIFLLLFCILWAVFVEPNLLKLKIYNIQDDSLAGMRVVLISDLHLKPSDNKKLKKVVDKINQTNADIVLITGDFINGSVPGLSMSEHEIASGLMKIKTHYGIYAVLGNHDYIDDETKLVDELESANINVLRNDNRYIKEKKVFIAGIEDDTMGVPDIKNALQKTSCPRILLMHSPDMYPELKKQVNLVVAGHNHGGQIVLPLIGPLFLPARTGRKYAYGFVNDGYKKIIITKGIGTSVIHTRFNCVPEIVLIKFVK